MTRPVAHCLRSRFLGPLTTVTLLFASSGCVPEAPSGTAAAGSASARRMPLRPRYNPNIPLLAVLAGKGVGPIRIGANVATIERLLQGPCELRSPELCRYVSRGLDFHLVGGITQWIHVQRPNRPAGRSADGLPMEFGYFPGMIPPDLRFGMIPAALQEHLGPPERVEKVPGPNPQSTVELHHYPGLVLEYDWWAKTEKLILGGIRIIPDRRIDRTAPARPDAGAGAAGIPPTTDAGLDASTKPAATSPAVPDAAPEPPPR